MSKGKAITLGIFSFWPCIYIILFMVTIFFMMVLAFTGNTPSNESSVIMKMIVPLHLFTMFVIFALLTIYLIYLFKTDVVPKDKKPLWAIALVLGNIVAMPIFWYIYIWKNVKESGSPEIST